MNNGTTEFAPNPECLEEMLNRKILPPFMIFFIGVWFILLMLAIPYIIVSIPLWLYAVRALYNFNIRNTVIAIMFDDDNGEIAFRYLHCWFRRPDRHIPYAEFAYHRSVSRYWRGQYLTLQFFDGEKTLFDFPPACWHQDDVKLLSDMIEERGITHRGTAKFRWWNYQLYNS
ncbi:MAG: hypothetical protein ABIR47_12270 [Candidatus Kapaibacterium sp.]